MHTNLAQAVNGVPDSLSASDKSLTIISLTWMNGGSHPDPRKRLEGERRAASLLTSDTAV
jgi:hypothetical protein